VFDRQRIGQYGDGEVSSTLAARDYKDATDLVAFTENHAGRLYEMGVTNAITTGGGKPGQGYQAVREGLSVRRLTPTECERLQGFPDGFTQIPWRGKEPENCPDGPRYKALGNSFAVPVVRWLGERIQAVEDLQ
jgi:DNA (cytosine-5)-methyltransferase 1